MRKHINKIPKTHLSVLGIYANPGTMEEQNYIDGLSGRLILRKIRKRNMRLYVVTGAIMLSGFTAVALKHGWNFPAEKPAYAGLEKCAGTLVTPECLKLDGVLGRPDRDNYQIAFKSARNGNPMALEMALKNLRDKKLVSYVEAQRLTDGIAAVRASEFSFWMLTHTSHPLRGQVRIAFEKKYPTEFNEYSYNESLRKTSDSTPVALSQMDGASTDLKLQNIVNREFNLFLTGDSGDNEKPVNANVARSGKTRQSHSFKKGLNAWQNGDFSEAGILFRNVAFESVPDAEKAAASFWAYRASMINNDFQQAEQHLQEAAGYKWGFYSLLAAQVQGMKNSWYTAQQLEMERARFERFKNNPAIITAKALTEIGENNLAREVLEREVSTLDMEKKLFVTIIADYLGLQPDSVPGQRVELNSVDVLKTKEYHIPNLKPEGGFKLDKALLYAIMKNESGFISTAISPQGALGLMQVMPETAGYISNYDPQQAAQALMIPEKNISLGQKYLQYLMKQRDIGRNLFYVLSAYNAGPGNFGKWRENIQDGNDPLLFLELIPADETREYVQNVVADYWIYKSLFKEDHDSILEIASGNWPMYPARPVSPFETARKS